MMPLRSHTRLIADTMNTHPLAGRILSIAEHPHFGVKCGRVDFNGSRADIVLAHTPEASVGDYVLAPFGVAMAVIEEDEARRAFDMLRDPELADDGLAGGD